MNKKLVNKYTHHVSNKRRRIRDLIKYTGVRQKGVYDNSIYVYSTNIKSTFTKKS